MIANKEVKRTFKVFLDSNKTNSYTGNQFNATYFIDLKYIIFDDNDFDKSYYMSCDFISRADTIANNGINSNNVYTLHLDAGKGLNVYAYNHGKNSSFLIPVSVSQEVTATPQTYFNLQSINQKPVFLQNIRNLNILTLNLINSTTNATFTGSAVDANLRYICVLTFVEA
jgi:hypothetical protein